MKCVPLQNHEVTFHVHIEPEKTVLAGFFDGEDADWDALLEGQIARRLRLGQCEAWCKVVVTAIWLDSDGHMYTGTSAHGNCVLDSTDAPEHGEATPETPYTLARSAGLYTSALGDLNDHLIELIRRGETLARALTPNRNL